MYVTETLWPDFSRARLLEALADFQQRERRYGGLGTARERGRAVVASAAAHKSNDASGRS
jgi:undecaprenyl diphosphate synthase